LIRALPYRSFSSILNAWYAAAYANCVEDPT